MPVGGEESLQEIQEFLLCAWKERWKPSSWAMQVKKLLENKSSKSKILADLLLKQIFLGSISNEVLLSYLSYATTTQLISHATFYSAVSRIVDFSKPRCMNRILELIALILPSTSCKSGEDSICLAGSLLSLLSWLQTVCIMSIRIGQGTVTDLCISALALLLENQNLCGLVLISSVNNTELWNVVCQLGEQLCEADISMLSEKSRSKMIKVTSKITRLTFCQLAGNQIMELNGEEDVPSTVIQTIINVQSLLRPLESEETVASLLESVACFQRMSPSSLFVEILRACLTALSESKSGSWNEIVILCFLNFKLPKILKILLQRSYFKKQLSTHSLSLIKLSELSNLLEIVDRKLCCNAFEVVVTLLHSSDIITNEDWDGLLKSRAKQSRDLDENNVFTKLNRAKNQLDDLMQCLDGSNSTEITDRINICMNNLEMVLASAASTGTLRKFAQSLVRVNNLIKKQTYTAENVQLFDVTFTILCVIVQRYGKQILIDEVPSNTPPFFILWANQYLNEELSYEQQSMQVPKSAYLSTPFTPTQSFLTMTTGTVDNMLQMFTREGEAEFNYTELYQMCMMSSSFVKEIIKPWTFNVVTEATVKSHLNRLKGKVSCLSISIYAAWYRLAQRCSYVEREKCFSCLKYIMESIKAEQEEHVEDNVRLSKLKLLSKICTRISLGGLKLSSDDESTTDDGNECDNHNFEDYVRLNKSPYDVISDTLSRLQSKHWFGCADLNTLFKLWFATSSTWFCEAILQVLNNERTKENSFLIADAIACLTLIQPTNLIPLMFIQLLHCHFDSSMHQWKPRAFARLLTRVMLFGLIYSGEYGNHAVMQLSSVRKRQRSDSFTVPEAMIDDGNRSTKVPRLDYSSALNEDLTFIPDSKESAKVNDCTSSRKNDIAEEKFARVFMTSMELLLRKFHEIFKKNRIGPSVTFAMYFLKQYCLTNTDPLLKPSLHAMALELIPLIPGQVDVDLVIRFHDLTVEEDRRNCADYLLLQRHYLN